MGRAIRVKREEPPEADQMPDPELSVDTLRRIKSWSDVYEREARVELEIGFGKGRFLIERAHANPETDYLGIERATSYAKLARYRIQRRVIPNVRLIQADAEYVLTECVPEASLDAIHILFPDPWPKKRHHKRRLINPAFSQILTNVLKVDGLLNVATDHADYAQAIEETLSVQKGLRRLDSFELEEDFLALTNYGSKYLIEGRSFHRWSLQKTAL